MGLFSRINYRNDGPAHSRTRKLLDLANGEAHYAISQSVQRVVYAHAYAHAGFHASATLAHNDAASANFLIAEALNAKPSSG
jgi:hypothetical protein